MPTGTPSLFSVKISKKYSLLCTELNLETQTKSSDKKRVSPLSSSLSSDFLGPEQRQNLRQRRRRRRQQRGANGFCCCCSSSNTQGESDVPLSKSQKRRRSRRHVKNISALNSPSQFWFVNRNGISPIRCTCRSRSYETNGRNCQLQRQRQQQQQQQQQSSQLSYSRRQERQRERRRERRRQQYQKRKLSSSSSSSSYKNTIEYRNSFLIERKNSSALSSSTNAREEESNYWKRNGGRIEKNENRKRETGSSNEGGEEGRRDGRSGFRSHSSEIIDRSSGFACESDQFESQVARSASTEAKFNSYDSGKGRIYEKGNYSNRKLYRRIKTPSSYISKQSDGNATRHVHESTFTSLYNFQSTSSASSSRASKRGDDKKTIQGLTKNLLVDYESTSYESSSSAERGRREEEERRVREEREKEERRKVHAISSSCSDSRDSSSSRRSRIRVRRSVHSWDERFSTSNFGRNCERSRAKETERTGDEKSGNDECQLTRKESCDSSRADSERRRSGESGCMRYPIAKRFSDISSFSRFSASSVSSNEPFESNHHKSSTTSWISLRNLQSEVSSSSSSSSFISINQIINKRRQRAIPLLSESSLSNGPSPQSCRALLSPLSSVVSSPLIKRKRYSLSAEPKASSSFILQEAEESLSGPTSIRSAEEKDADFSSMNSFIDDESIVDNDIIHQNYFNIDRDWIENASQQQQQQHQEENLFLDDTLFEDIEAIPPIDEDLESYITDCLTNPPSPGQVLNLFDNDTYLMALENNDAKKKTSKDDEKNDDIADKSTSALEYGIGPGPEFEKYRISFDSNVTDYAKKSTSQQQRLKRQDFLKREEILWSQYMVLDQYKSVFKDLPPSKEPLFAFSEFYSGAGSQIFGTSCKQKCDLSLSFSSDPELNSPAKIKFLNFHGSYYHNAYGEEHNQRCSNNRRRRQQKITKNIENINIQNERARKSKRLDCLRTSYGEIMSSVHPENLELSYSTFDECDYFHKPVELVCNKSGKKYKDIKTLLKNEYSYESLLPMENEYYHKEYTYQEFLEKIQSEELTGFVTIEGGTEQEIDWNNPKMEDFFGFCVQKYKLSLEDLSAHTINQILQLNGWTHLSKKEKNEKLTEFLKKQPERCLNARGFNGIETLSTSYLNWLIKNRGFKNFKILHFLRYNFRSYKSEYLTNLLEKKHECKKKNDLAQAECVKLLLNGNYGYYGMESTNYSKTCLLTESSLKKKKWFKKKNAIVKKGQLIGVTLKTKKIKISSAIKASLRKGQAQNQKFLSSNNSISANLNQSQVSSPSNSTISSSSDSELSLGEDEEEKSHSPIKKNYKIISKPEFLYSVELHCPDDPIRNCIAQAVGVLSNSKKMFLNHCLVLTQCVDPRLAEICYNDTDSIMMSLTHKNLLDTIKPEMLDYWLKANVIANPSIATSSEHGKMTHDGSYRKGLFRNIKMYRLLAKIKAEEELKSINNSDSGGVGYTRCKGLTREQSHRLSNMDFLPQSLNNITSYRSCIRATNTHEILIRQEHRKISDPVNFKAYVTHGGNHTFPFLLLNE